MKAAEGETPQTLELRGSQTIDTVADLCIELQHWLQNEQTPVLDLSGVEECDAACIQVLYSASAAARMSNRELRISAVSPAVKGVIDSLGLEHDTLFGTTTTPAPESEKPGVEEEMSC